MSQTLGSTKRKFVFSCEGIISTHLAHLFAESFIELAGMTSARKGRIDHYPYKGGGGEGYTGFFPLMESFLILDVYIDLNHTEILLSTCKPDRFPLEAIINFLNKKVGSTRLIGAL